MKVLKSIIIVALISIALPTQAKDGERNNRKAKQKIATIISSADTEQEGAVNVKFKLTADGSVEIVSLESSRHTLKTLVKDKLSKIRIKGQTIDVNKLFNMNFIFHQEKG